MLSLNNYLTSNGRHPEALELWSGEFIANANKTIAIVSEFASLANFKIEINSGWRYPNLNKKVGGASQSKHLFAQAVDVNDPDHIFHKWLSSNIGLLRERGCAIESSLSTPGWTHLQTVIPNSGNIIFNPR